MLPAHQNNPKTDRGLTLNRVMTFYLVIGDLNKEQKRQRKKKKLLLTSS